MDEGVCADEVLVPLTILPLKQYLDVALKEWVTSMKTEHKIWCNGQGTRSLYWTVVQSPLWVQLLQSIKLSMNLLTTEICVTEQV